MSSRTENYTFAPSDLLIGLLLYYVEIIEDFTLVLDYYYMSYIMGNVAIVITQNLTNGWMWLPK